MKTTIEILNGQKNTYRKQEFHGSPAQADRWVLSWYGKPCRRERCQACTVFHYIGFSVYVLR